MKAATKTQAEALNKLILSDPLIQEFKKYEEALKQHPELLALEDEIKEDSQIILKKKALGELTEEDFENHPLIVNYLNLKSEVNDYLIQVETIINEELLKAID